jgi:hypothetical protein
VVTGGGGGFSQYIMYSYSFGVGGMQETLVLPLLTEALIGDMLI